MFETAGLTDFKADGSVEFVLFCENLVFGQEREKGTEGDGSMMTKKQKDS